MAFQRIACPACGASQFKHDESGQLTCGACNAVYSSPRQEIICGTCGTGNPAAAKICMECGRQLMRICPGCGQANPPGLDHCSECATPLDVISSMLVRHTGEGKRLSQEQLMLTKEQDADYLAQQSARIRAQDEARRAALEQERAKVLRQQRLVLIGAFLAGLLLFLGVAAAVFLGA